MKSGLNQTSLQHRFIYEYLRALNCPRSLAVWLLFIHEEHQQLVDLEFDPFCYNDLIRARDALAATKILSKAPFLSLGIDTRKVAIEKFKVAELACQQANRRIRSGRFNCPTTQPILLMAARKIDRILGSLKAEEFVDSCNFGPGATSHLSRRLATLPNKYSKHCYITSDAYDFVRSWWDAAFPRWNATFCLSDCAKIVTVAKNAKTDRTIAIEPHINMWLQKGFGTLIRERLRDYGLDLSSQSHNQQRARIASLYNQLVTVDFSAASDTIAKELVYELIPHDWFCAMGSVRTKYGTVDGESIFFEKYSSMGNGFTFELETLIFYALALSVTELVGADTKGITVYGDDVVLPTEAYQLYVTVCEDLGFTVNKEKSFSSSYYRESCGSHYWNGADIKPIFMKENLVEKLQVVKLANNVRRYAHRRATIGCDRRLRICYEVLVRPLKGVTRISDGYGDCGLIENIDHPTVSCKRASRGFEGFHVRLWIPTAEMKFYSSEGLYLSKLRALGATCDSDVRPDRRGIGNDVPIPCRTKHTKVRMLIPMWYDLGKWV